MIGVHDRDPPSPALIGRDEPPRGGSRLAPGRAVTPAGGRPLSAPRGSRPGQTRMLEVPRAEMVVEWSMTESRARWLARETTHSAAVSTVPCRHAGPPRPARS